MAPRQTRKANKAGGKTRSRRRMAPADPAMRREALEQIEIAQRLLSTAIAPALRSRLLATVEHLSGHLPDASKQLGADAALAIALELSGPAWVGRFPGSKEPADCVVPFRTAIESFLKALSDAGASVNIAATLRPPERAYLMHWSWKIANNSAAPAEVPPMAGVAIAWTHRDAAGQPDLPKSVSAAKQMVSGYGIVSTVPPACKSRHTEGRAIDMTIAWSGDLSIKDANGVARKINTEPRDGMNIDLHRCGATYGVMKAVFAGDWPHWSDDGH